jgi:hypothetical protein
MPATILSGYPTTLSPFELLLHVMVFRRNAGTDLFAVQTLRIFVKRYGKLILVVQFSTKKL